MAACDKTEFNNLRSKNAVRWEDLIDRRAYPWSEIATRLGSDLRKRPEAGRFRKFVEFDQSKGIGGRVWPR